MKALIIRSDTLHIIIENLIARLGAHLISHRIFFSMNINGGK